MKRVFSGFGKNRALWVLKDFRVGHWVASFFLGVAFALSVYNYLLIRFFPAGSLRVLILLALALLVGWAAYGWLLSRWMLPQLGRMTPLQRGSLVGVSLLLGVFLMFAGTPAVKASPGSIPLLLPTRTLHVVAPASQLVSDPQVVLLYIKASSGEIPFSGIKFQGWEKRGSQLVLLDFARNSLDWSGKPGQELALVLQRSPQGGYIQVDWGGFTEVVNLRLDREEKYLYKHEYPVPFLASGMSVLFLLAVNFVTLSAALGLLLWDRRMVWIPALTASAAAGGGMERGQAPHAGRLRWIWIGVLVLVALLLRVWDLGLPYVYIDEFAHLDAAREVLSGQPLAEVYQRGLYIVTLPVALFMRLFGAHIWAAKLPGVLMNALAILPLFLLMEKVNGKAAILTCALFAVNPWMIAVARSVREYAFYPFYFYFICLAMILLLGGLPSGLVLRRDWRKLASPRNLALVLLLLLPALFALLVDPLSTFKVVLVIYAVMLLLIAVQLDLSDRGNRMILTASALALLVITTLFLRKQVYVSLIPVLNLYPLRYFFPDPEQQWFFGRLGLLFALAFAAALFGGIFLARKNIIPLFLALLGFASMSGFILLFSRFIRPRYFLNVEIWFIPLIGFGFHVIFTMMRALSGSRPVVLAALLVFIILGVNGGQILKAFTYAEPGVMPVTDEYQYNFERVDDLVKRESQPADVLVGSFYATYASWTGIPRMEIFRLDARYRDEAQAYIEGVIAGHDSGWLVLDDRYDRGRWALQTLQEGNKTLEYLGSLDGQRVWRWHTNP